MLDLDHATGLLLAGERLYGTSAVGYRYRVLPAARAPHPVGRMARTGRAVRAMPFVRLNRLYGALGDAAGGRWSGARAKLSRLARA